MATMTMNTSLIQILSHFERLWEKSSLVLPFFFLNWSKKTLFQWIILKISHWSLYLDWSLSLALCEQFTFHYFRFATQFLPYEYVKYFKILYEIRVKGGKKIIIRIIIMHQVFLNATVAHCFHIYPHDDSIKCGFLPCWLLHDGWSLVQLRLLTVQKMQTKNPKATM